MQYKRSPIEIESPEQFGYENIACNLAESSITDARLQDLNIRIDEGLVLQYGDHRGKPELRELLASEAEGLRPDDVLLTVGAAGALFIVATALLERGDSVVVAFPNYATNITTPRLIGCRMEYLPLTFEGRFQHDLDRLSSLVNPTTRLVSLTTPHNPTGSVMSDSDLRRVVDMVESNRTYLLVDETYRDLSFGAPPPLAASLSPRVVSVSSLSKAYGLPGIRLGWLICRDEGLMETFLAAKEQIHIGNSVVDEEIAFRYLEGKVGRLNEIQKEARARLQIMKDWMGRQDRLEWVEPEGGVVCFPRIRPDRSVDLAAFYRVLNTKYKTFVGPGHWFEMDRRYMRIGYGWPTRTELEEGLRSILRSVEETEGA